MNENLYKILIKDQNSLCQAKNQYYSVLFNSVVNYDLCRDLSIHNCVF